MSKKVAKPPGILDWQQVDEFRIDLLIEFSYGGIPRGQAALLTERCRDHHLGGAIVFRDEMNGSPLRWIASGSWKDSEQFYRPLKTLFTQIPPIRLPEITLVRMLVFNMLKRTEGNHDWQWMEEMSRRIRNLQLFSLQALEELVNEMNKRNKAGRRTTGYQALGLPEPVVARK